MSHNPYSPPAAEVDDVVTEQPMERPVQVMWAVRCLWASVIIGIARDIVRLGLDFAQTSDVPVARTIGGIIGTALSVLIAMWFIGKISAGRNWARILMLVITLLGLAFMPVLWPYLTAIPPYHMVVSVIQELFTLTVLILVFTGPGRFWFKRRG